MNKTFTLAALIAAASALNLHISSEKKEYEEPIQVTFDTQEKPVIKPKKDSLAQVFAISEQYVHQCSDTFTRLSGSAVPNVDTVIAAGTPWTDTTFDVNAAMYLKSTTGVSWTRAGSFFPKSAGYSLFTGNAASGINIDDSIQGSLGDCWMISTLAAMVENPQRLYKAFNPKSYGNAAGIYSIQMYNLGVPIQVVIDDYLPIYTAWGDNYFMWMNTQKELWPIFAEKAFAKLMGNYYSIEGGFPTDSGSAWLGTPNQWYSTSTKTADAIWTDVKGWDTAGNIMSSCTSTSQMGIIGGHCYSLISANTLSNGQRLYKIRNPWGGSEWTGAYADTDPIWTTGTFATEVGFTNKNDGDFFMKAEDFATYFTEVVSVLNPDNLINSYWLAIGNGDTFGTTGTSAYCGSICKRNTFTITSPVAQTIYVSPYVSFQRQYVEAPCTDGAYSATTYHYAQVGSSARVWDEGPTHFDAISIAAGASVTAYVELDWTRNNIRKDFSLVVWGSASQVTIAHSSGTASASYPLYSSSTTIVTPPPTEVCTATATVANYDATRKLLLLKNGCTTLDANYTITMATTSWSNVATYDAAHANPVCTASGSNTSCQFRVSKSGQKFAAIFYKSGWDGVYTSAYTLI